MSDDLAQWDIVSSVGLTALAVAAARSIETHAEEPLIEDRYAEKFVLAADPPVPFPLRPGDHDDDENGFWNLGTTYMGLRSRFFDDYFLTAAASGVDQVVLLAAGLDARAYRLSWPTGCDLYEIDQPKVLEFKDEVLTEQAAEAACRRHSVPMDLREDWASALLAAGFDPARPTAWLAEGLLPYLPARAEAELFATVQRLSAPGSRIAVETTGENTADTLLAHPMMRGSAERFGVDLQNLWSREPRQNCRDRLRAAGWQVDTHSTGDLARKHSRTLTTGLDELMASNVFVTATRGPS